MNTAKPLLPGIHHVALICSDYARSKAFYSETLGLRIVHEAYRRARDSWKLDLEISPGVQLELFSFPHPPPRPSRPEALGLRHLAFMVPSVAAVVSELRRRGVACEPIRTDEYTGRSGVTKRRASRRREGTGQGEGGRCRVGIRPQPVRGCRSASPGHDVQPD